MLPRGEIRCAVRLTTVATPVQLQIRRLIFILVNQALRQPSRDLALSSGGSAEPPMIHGTGNGTVCVGKGTEADDDSERGPHPSGGEGLWHFFRILLQYGEIFTCILMYHDLNSTIRLQNLCIVPNMTTKYVFSVFFKSPYICVCKVGRMQAQQQLEIKIA